MKICMFTNTYLPHVGGVARSVATFAKDLRKTGHEVLIIAPTFPAMAEESEKEVIRVPAIQKFNGTDFSVRIPLLGIINDAVSAFKPDIIHSNHPFLLGDAALRTAHSLDVPLVFTHHTLYENYTHYVPLDSKAMRQFAINLATEYANLCNRVIAPSSSVKKLLIERGVKSAVDVLPTGIDIDFFTKGDGRHFRQKYEIRKDMTIIGHVGRLAKEKNLPYLVAAVARYIRKNNNVCFVVAGKGDAEHDISNLFQKRNIEDRLIMPGNFTDSALADCYAAMDIFVFASHSETQGLVLAEAMAASTPVIALSASGVNDVMQDKINGIRLAADASEDEFASAIAQALDDGQQLAAWGRNAYKTALEFSREKSVEKLVALYRETIIAGDYPHRNTPDLLEEIMTAIETEWELLRGKSVAAVSSLSENGLEK